MLQRAFWRDVLDRAVRQAFQVLVPFLTLAATAGRIDGVQLRTVATVAATAAPARPGMATISTPMRTISPNWSRSSI